MKTSNNVVVPMRPRPAEPSPVPRRRLRINGYRLAIFVALIYFIVTVISQQVVLSDLQSRLNSIQVEIEAVKIQKAELQKRLEYYQSEEYIQDEARDRFGLALPGEIQYITLEEDEGADQGGE